MADTQNTNVQEQDIHQLLKVKREKLANLQQAGKDPFQITKYEYEERFRWKDIRTFRKSWI